MRTAAGEADACRSSTWDHVIGPDESEELVGKLAAFPELHAYKAGRSYRGRDISVMELTLPAASELVSLAKLTALKPTMFITGRQHANEVSSTSHILKLAELLVSDPAYKSILKKVNVVLHPVENPDGAQMAYELQKLTPTHMLHAGRYSALGMDVASQVGVADPLLPEALVRSRLWQEWLPDIYLNPHGYPSHEWVQQFAGYVPPGFRTYWTTRGWYTSVTGLRDPRYPEHTDAVAALRESIVREINSNPDVKAMNLRHQARYRRWAYGFSPYVYGQEIYKETAIYYTDRRPAKYADRAGRAPGGAAAAAVVAAVAALRHGGMAAGDVHLGRHGGAGRDRAGRVAQSGDQAGILVPDGAHQLPARWPAFRRADRGERAARLDVDHPAARPPGTARRDGAADDSGGRPMTGQ